MAPDILASVVSFAVAAVVVAATASGASLSTTGTTATAHPSALASSSRPSTPSRLVVNGSQILDPTTGEPVLLRGFNWYLPYTSTLSNPAGGHDDGHLTKQLLPGATVARLVGVFWWNYPAGVSKDCHTEDASQGYLKPSCLRDLDDAVNTATAAGLWVIVAGRAEYAAGQAPSTPPGDVFNNATLRSQYLAMWSFLAEHYKSFDRIAAYEIMSEPRVKTVADSVVASFMADGCAAVHSVDAATPCMVGPAPFYKPWKLSSTYLVPNDTNVLYTADFFEPDAYVQQSFNGPNYYPGDYECDVAFKGWTQVFCPTNRTEMLRVDKAWLANLLQQYVVAFREAHSVPVVVNQFGAKRAVGDDHGRQQYTADVLSVFEAADVHHMYWIWRWHGKADGDHWGGFEVIHDWANSTESWDAETLGLFNASWSGDG